MSRPTDIRISLSESKGPVAPRAYRYVDPDGIPVESVTVGTATACPGCGKAPINGEIITKVFGTWWHGRCGAKHLREIGANQAWIALGMQLERNPSRFNHSEIKAITRNILKIAQAMSHLGDEPEDPDDDLDVGLRQLLEGP